MLNMSREVTCVGLCADKMALLSTPRSALIPLHQQRNDASQQLVLSVSATILYEHDLIAASRFNEYYWMLNGGTALLSNGSECCCEL